MGHEPAVTSAGRQYSHRWDYHCPVDLGEIKQYLRRTAWGDFPEVLIYAEPRTATKHPFYAAAKIGDAKAADALVVDFLSESYLQLIMDLTANREPRLLAVHALEQAGMNAIPRVLARQIAQHLGLALESGILQRNRVSHTKADGYHRLAFPPVFEGETKEVNYILVDDFVGQGGTLANLRGHVETRGGKVVGALSLAGQHRSSKLRLENETLGKVREKHGNQLEEWWISTFGYGLDRLTESEAAYLFRSDSFDVITARLAAARGAGDR